MEYKFTKPLSDDVKSKLTSYIQSSIAALVGECDDVFVEYVMVMVSKQKTMEEIAMDLEAFIGPDDSLQFAQR